jgi:multidrug efflux pump subunit AcrA (membrane-fusion protein)
MTTSSEYAGPPAQADPAGMSLQTDEAKATVAEIKAENEALKEADLAAEAQAEAAAEQARQLAEVTGEVLEELKEMNEGASPA